MKKLKKGLALLLVLALAIGISACTATSEPPSADQTPSPPLASQSAEDPITLTLWSQWSSDADGMKAPLDTVLADFQREHPNIKVEMDTINTEAYKQKVKVASAADELPDVFFSWGAGFAKPFVEAGKVLDLTSYVDNGVKEKLLAGTLDNFTYGDKIYALPSYMWLGVLYCNKDLFEKNNIKLPDTYDDLLVAVEAFNKLGITPVAVGEKELWPGIQWQNALAMRTAGVDACVKALSKEASFDTPEFAASGNKLTELVKAGAFSPGCMGVEELEAEADFANERAAMLYMGDWAAATFIQDNAPVSGKVVAMNFPSLADGKDPNAFLGGAIDTFMISANTEHPQEAYQLLAYLSENLGREGYLSGACLPAWKVEVPPDSINPLTQQIVELSQNATGFMLAWDTFLEGADADTHLNAVAELFGGKSDGAAFAKAMESINQ